MIDICICFGPSWSTKIATQIFSAVKSCEEPVTFHLVSDTFSDQLIRQCNLLQDKLPCDIRLIDGHVAYLANYSQNKNVTNRFSMYTLYRLLIPDLINVEKVLYLDADTLVLGDLSELYDIDLGNSLVAGCVDTGIQPRHVRRIGSNISRHAYLNAGVLLMNLKEMREANISREWSIMANTVKYGAHDQDIIHLTTLGRVKIIPPRFNCSLSTSLDIADEEIVVMHYAGIKDDQVWVKNLPKAHLWDIAESNYLDFEMKNTPNCNPQPKIQRMIGYGWFGGGDKNKVIQTCIESWSATNPTYKIVELNEDNCDMNCNEFVKAAYASKKYAFVADFFRMKFMYEKGCITLDADVELLKPLDEFLNHSFFSGQEIDDSVLITATMGAETGSPIVGMILDYYQTAIFKPARLVPNTKFITALLKPLILSSEDGIIRLQWDGWLYPKEYFCNYDHKKKQVLRTPLSYALHHFNGSWLKK